MSVYNFKATKLRTRSDSENKVTEKMIEKSNKDKADRLIKLKMDTGVEILGGYYKIESGMSFIGMGRFPEVGESLVIRGPESLTTSVIREVNQKTENSWVLKTMNSFYLLEKLDK